MSRTETDAEPTTDFRDGDLHHTCPCGKALESDDAGHGSFSETHAETIHRCPNGHRWKRISMIGFSARWERLEGVEA